MLLTLEGITKVPIFTKVVGGFNGIKAEKMYSTAIVRYDTQFRITVYSPHLDPRNAARTEDSEEFVYRHTQADLHQVLMVQFHEPLTPFPMTLNDAFLLVCDGLPAAAGGCQKGSRKRKSAAAAAEP